MAAQTNSPANKSANIVDHFRQLPDPRGRRPVYPLINIAVMAICAVICGAIGESKTVCIGSDRWPE